MSLHSDLADRARTWLDQDPDPVTSAELAALLDRAERGGDDAVAAGHDLHVRFSGQLEFGTAGIRGVLGAGPTRMNRVLVRKVTAGLADYLAATVDGARERGVVIGHDARRLSREFAEDAARVLGGAGFRFALASAPWPTPTTAWAVLDRGAAAGVMVTASHNPPEYNGYKVYWGNGAQIIPPHDVGIAAAIHGVGRTDRLPMPPVDELRAEGRLTDLDDGVRRAYLAAAAELVVAPEAPRGGIRIAYTPLHGVGGQSVEELLAGAGFEVHTEASQREPDGGFPTVAFPNPEEPGAMDRVVDLARRIGAELVLANDPDADRLAVALPVPGGYAMLTGDQVGVLLADYLLARTPRDRRRLVACSLVSSQQLRYLADHHGAESRETLTGFKWIANVALAWQADTGGRFVLGYEEALGYTVGELVRDKDGVSAALLFAELAAWNRAQGRTVAEHLDDLYRRVGLFVTEQVSITATGPAGLDALRAAMRRFRDAPPAAIAGHAIEEAVDLMAGAGGLPPSDVLVYKLAGGRRIIMRPSGTEPKLKSYYEVRVDVQAGEPIGDARARGLADLAGVRDAHQALLAG
jgi:phosphomannomutase